MKKTFIVIGVLLSFAYAAFVPPAGTDKMPIKGVSFEIDSPYLQVNAELAGTVPAK